MSELIYFLHRDGIIEFNRATGARREMCETLPMPPKAAVRLYADAARPRAVNVRRSADRKEPMRLFNRADFLKLPAGIAYCKGKPFYFEHLAFKTEAMEHDWAAFDPQYIDAKSSDEAEDRLREMLTSNVVSYPMETADCRDGCFDEEEIFLVFEVADLQALRVWIDDAIAASANLTTVANR